MKKKDNSLYNLLMRIIKVTLSKLNHAKVFIVTNSETFSNKTNYFKNIYTRSI